MKAENERPLVSVVVPCRNEAAHLGPLIDSILATSHPLDRLEIVFVDGMSTDGTRKILDDTARGHAFIRVLDNPAMITPTAMNLGIRATRGEIIVRIDAHAEYPRDYIPRCVALLKSEPAIGNAGGRAMTVPNGEGPWARAVAFVTAHRLGVGDSAFRTSRRAGPVDTVPCGTFRRRVLEEVGLFDERLTRNQDNELNSRIIRAGYTIAFDPAIHIRYRNQPSLRGLARQAYHTGKWNVYTLLLHPYTWKPRRFVPLAFVSYLATLVLAAALRAPGRGWLAAPLALYLGLVAACSARSGAAGGAARVAATFVSYHLSYGAGSLAGILRILLGRWRAELGRPLTKRGG